LDQQRLVGRVLKPALFIAALLPLALMIAAGVQDELGANPVQEITYRTGRWGLRFLLLTLAVTPLRQSSGWHAVVRLRRMLGLFAFFYLSLHLLTYVWLDQFFSWPDVVEDVRETSLKPAPQFRRPPPMPRKAQTSSHSARELPAVYQVLDHPILTALLDRVGPLHLADEVRDELENARGVYRIAEALGLRGQPLHPRV